MASSTHRRPARASWALICLLCLLITGCVQPVARAERLSPTGAFQPPRAIAFTGEPSPAASTEKPAVVLNSTPSFTPAPSATPTHYATPTPTVTATLRGIPHHAGEIAVPILLYHRVSDNAGAIRYAVTTDQFKAHMKYLAENGYETITVSQLANTIRFGGNLPPRPVVITFDDGFIDVYDNALPVMQSYGFTATCYIITGTQDSSISYGYMQSEELGELVKAGWEIGSHSVSHVEIQTSKLGMGNELLDSKAALEKALGITVQSFSYPYGVANNWVKGQTEDRGYLSAVGLGVSNVHSKDTLYYLSRREVYRTYTLNDFIALLALPPEPTATPTLTPPTFPTRASPPK